MKRTLLLFLAFVALWKSVFAYDFSAVAPSGQTLYYYFNSSGCVVTYPGRSNINEWWSGYTKPIGNLMIPDSVTYNGVTYAVTAIGERAFSNCENLTSVTVPRPIKSIGNSAFRDCSGITDVVFNADECGFAGERYRPSSYSSNEDAVKYPAFDGCANITSFHFGENVKIIPAYMCSNKGGITSVNIPKSVISIGHSAFRSCTGLTSVIFNADSCVSVGDNIVPYPTINEERRPAFYECYNITSFTIGDSVKQIPAYLCYGLHNIFSVVIPDAIKSISSWPSITAIA